MQPNGKKYPFIYQKLLALVQKNLEKGGPRSKMEENIAREFRLCKDDIRRVFREINLEEDFKRAAMKKKRTSTTDQRLFEGNEYAGAEEAIREEYGSHH